MFETCYLHIGLQKTGSTSLQHSLKSNVALLEELGIHYPSVMANHARLAVSDRPTGPRARMILDRAGQDDPRDRLTIVKETEARYREAFATAARQSGARALVLSSEHFNLFSKAGSREFIDFLSGFARRIRVVAYVRHPASLIVSSAQQSLKGGDFTLDSFDPASVMPKVSRRLERYRAVVGLDNMVLRPFEKGKLYRGDVVKDFARLIGMEDSVIDKIAVDLRNESLSCEAALLADAIAKARSTSSAPMKRELRRKLVKYLTSIRGSKFAFSDERNAEIMEAASEEAQILAERFGVELSEPALPRLGELWSDETVEDMARLVHDLVAENLALKRKRGSAKKG